jgi:hypothetical protein
MDWLTQWIERKREANRQRWEAMRVRRAWVRATFFPGRKWRRFLFRVYMAYVLGCFVLSLGFHLLVPDDWGECFAVFLAMQLAVFCILRWLLPELPGIARAQVPSPPKPRSDSPPPSDPGTSGSPAPVLPATPAPTLEASRKLPVPILTDAGARR